MPHRTHAFGASLAATDGAIIAEPLVVAYYISFAAWGLLDPARHLAH